MTTNKSLIFYIITIIFSCSANAAAKFDLFELGPTCQAITSDIISLGKSLESDEEFLFSGKNGWIFESKKDFSQDYGIRSQAELAAYKRFNQYMNNLGIQLVLVYVPNRAIAAPDMYPIGLFDESEYYRRVEKYKAAVSQLAQYGAIVPDLSEISTSEGFYWKRDTHWSPLGAKSASMLVADKLTTALPEMFDSNTQSFDLVLDGAYSITSSIQKNAEEICGFQMPAEYVKAHRTIQLGSESMNSLFGDEVESDSPEIILVGTSFSDLDKLNFGGYLEHSLETPVINYALSGGRAVGAWVNYLDSEFKVNKPDIIIWEMPSYYDLDSMDIFSKLNPMIYGGCTENALRSGVVNNFELGGEAKTLLFDISPLEILGEGVTIDIQFNDLDVRTAEITVWSAHGSKKNIRIKSSERATATGRFMFEVLKDSDFGQFMAFDINEIFMRDGTKASQEVVDNLNASVKLCNIPAPSQLAMAK